MVLYTVVLRTVVLYVTSCKLFFVCSILVRLFMNDLIENIYLFE